MKFKYDETFDIAYYKLTSEKIYETSDYSENIAVDIDDKGNVVGVEVQEYSKSLDELVMFFYTTVFDNIPSFEIEKMDFSNTFRVSQTTKREADKNDKYELAA